MKIRNAPVSGVDSVMEGSKITLSPAFLATTFLSLRRLVRDRPSDVRASSGFHSGFSFWSRVAAVSAQRCGYRQPRQSRSALHAVQSHVALALWLGRGLFCVCADLFLCLDEGSLAEKMPTAPCPPEREDVHHGRPKGDAGDDEVEVVRISLGGKHQHA